MDVADSALSPLLAAIGRAVLEKVLLLDIAPRLAVRDASLTRKERLPAGPLVAELTRLGLDDALAARVSRVIRRRNDVIHDPFGDDVLAKALASGNVAEAVRSVNACERFSALRQSSSHRRCSA